MAQDEDSGRAGTRASRITTPPKRVKPVLMHCLDRLPTFSAADALRAEESADLGPIRLHLEKLDALLQSADVGSPSLARGKGLSRGAVTEVYGPPGIGKTTLCMQAAAATLHTGFKVVWIDTATPLAGKRFEQILASTRASTSRLSIHEQLARFSHYVAPTLAHVLALVSHAPPAFPPEETALLVVDCLSTSIDDAYPRHAENRIASNKNDLARWVSDRRPAVITEIGSRLTRLAATRDIAILVTNNIVTKVRVGAEALLRPAVSGQEWDDAVETRLALFRDWGEREGGKSRPHAESSARFAELVKSKLSGDASRGTVRKLIAYQIDEFGICEMPEIATPALISPSKLSTRVQRKKRRFDEITYSGTEDSSSEYGWNASDDQLTAEGLVDD